MNRTTRIALLISGLGLLGIGVFAFAGDADAAEPDEPTVPPRPDRILTPADPAPEPGFIPPEDEGTAPSDETPDEPGDIPDEEEAPDLVPPTPEPTPPPSDNTAGKWASRHAALAELGYWSGPTAVPASGATVGAITAFQQDMEAARNIAQGQSGSAQILSQTYGFISPDGMWGPEVANWIAWARDNYALFFNAVQSSTGQPPGASSPGNA